MMTPGTLFIALLTLFTLLPAPARDSAMALDVAVIVHPDNPVNSISFPHLVKIFKQDIQFWDIGKRIHLIMQESGSPEKQIVLNVIFRLPDDQALKRLWLVKLYQGEIDSFPTTLSSNLAVRSMVSQVSNAIGFIDASQVDASVKVLEIDGKRPGDRSYPLKGP